MIGYYAYEGLPGWSFGEPGHLTCDNLRVHDVRRITAQGRNLILKVDTLDDTTLEFMGADAEQLLATCAPERNGDTSWIDFKGHRLTIFFADEAAYRSFLDQRKTTEVAS